ncbi:hypothetical protein LH51_03020 [Nitrincola sp. A-D6]|uniref:GGDEF domain-containing protein n=1 Tax=Nitrincola sp. A-D6 TaxID=1545442 RepID=UPI00051FB10C|nr:GGDEF domain-containing protein [Nitrincola sp. A-D6]KGK43079.1 hypothetical protein LH51_03020 [Nitrincola sp. A-D6]
MIGKRSGWLWLSLLSFSVILAWITYETRWVYPEMQRYFGDTGTLMGQQLASRGRHHLQDALAELTDTNAESDSLARALSNLDIAWGFINIAIYKERYSCTDPSLERLDRFIERIDLSPPPSAQESLTELLPVLQCATEIEQGQWDTRSAVAMEVAKRINFHQHMLLGGVVVLYLLGIGFWWLHEQQRQAFNQNLRDKLRWKNQALHDPLTGALNRRALDADLNLHFERMATEDYSFVMLMCDIDYFKPYNDTLGHAEGDKALQRVVVAIKDALRQEDRIYRYGGEELAVLLTGATRDEGVEIAFRALEAVEQLHIANPGSPSTYLTISIGISCANAGTSSPDALIRDADKKLYQAKHNGRNCLAT